MTELNNRVRNLVGRCVVAAVDDTTKMQTMQITLSAGEDREVERFQNYGFTSVPKAGAEGLAVAVGGDRGHTVVIAVDDRRYRLKALASGEVAVYNHTGASVVLKADGSIELVPATSGKIRLGGTLLTQAIPTQAFATAVCTALNTLTGGTFPLTPNLIPAGLTTKTEAI